MIKLNINWRKPLIYALLYLSGSKIIRYLHEIQKLESFSRKQLEDYQQNKLRALLLYAYVHVPYYQKVFKEIGLVNNRNQLQLKNFYKLPYLTKDILKTEGSNLYSDDYGKLNTYLNKSGGSSGQPTNILQSRDYSDWNIANKIYYKTFVNQQIGDRELRLWGSERDVMGENESIQKRIKDFLYNRKDLNAFRMTKKSMRSYIKTINKFKPSWIEAYASAIYELAVFAKNNNYKLHSPKGILTSAGTLYPYMKQTIEDVFAAKVFNRYGSREVGDLACSCLDGELLHLSMWNNYVEVKPIAGNKLGKIYVTNLNNYAMPLIRYDISDLASLAVPKKYCNCQRKTLLLEKVEGRETSVFKTKSGALVPAEFFIHFIGVVFNKGEIEQFQIVQEGFTKILIKYISRFDLKDQSFKHKIVTVIKKIMGQACQVKWQRVKSIETLPSGKYLYTVRKI